MILIKLLFTATQKIKQLLCVIRLLFIIFVVLVVVPNTLAKQKERYMKGQLNMLELVITVLFANISATAQVSNICLILPLCISHCLCHHHLFKTGKFDLKTARINLVQDNTKIIYKHKNWNILLFKEKLKIKELNPILNSGLKASKEL